MFSIDEMIAAFDVVDVNPNPARFDLKKAESINGDQIRLLDVDELADRITPYLGSLVASDEHRALLREATPLVQERMQLLGEAPALLGFLFLSDGAIVVDADAMPGDAGATVLDASIVALGAVTDWNHETIEQALRAALIDGLGLKPRIAFGPLRSAISGKRISPPLFESMQLLGKESSLTRLTNLRAQL